MMQPRAKRSLVNDILNDTGADSGPPAKSEPTATAVKAKKKAKPETVDPPTAAGSAEAEDAEVPRDEAVEDEGISDMEYMRRRMKRTLAAAEDEPKEQEEKTWEQDEAEDEGEVEGEVEADDGDDVGRGLGESTARDRSHDEVPPDDTDAKTVLETGRLFVRNLPYTATTEELDSLFAPHGEVSQVSRPP